MDLQSGQNYSLRCAASNMIPDGRFVWRLGDLTLRNPRPLLIETDSDLGRIVSQEIVISGEEQLQGKTIHCYHLQLDHERNVISTQTVSLRIEVDGEDSESGS